MPSSRDHCLKLYPWLGALALVAILAALPAGESDAKQKKHISLSPAEEYKVSLEATRLTMGDAKTQPAVSKFVGGPPDHCVNGPKESTLCVWPLSKKQRGWWPLAEFLGTGDRLNLVCEFPANDEPRPTESCSVHSQRSNRGMMKGTTKVPTRGRMPRGVSTKSLAMQNMSAQLLDRSKTAFQLSTLVGDAPYSCLNASASSMVCRWKTHNGTYGHGTLAHLIGTELGNRVVLFCELPRDGSPRGPDSCTVRVGS